VERIIRGFAVQASAKKISLLWKIDPDVPDLLHGDHIRLGQILKNLVANAIKFTDKGQVRVRIKAVEKHPDQATISFAVQDTGIGIPRIEQEKLFQSFTQLDPTYSKRYGGAGLGLIISKQLAQYMDGNIVVESEPGKGSTFTLLVSFPLAKHLSDSQTTPQRTQPLTAPMRILLAEDNMVNQAFLSRYLQHQGHQVTPVENGLKVLELLQKDAFDLILMDVQMPGMDGVEATKRIRTGQAGSDQDIPIIALTAYAMKGDRERFLQAGMTDYISKPVDFDLLQNKMQRYARNDKKIRN
jgi:CheY-like chemotaxis protein